MKNGRRKNLLLGILVAASLTMILFVPCAQALNQSFSDGILNFVIISGTPDVVKPGETVAVSISAKLVDSVNESDVLHVRLFVDTNSEPSKLVTQGDLVLPAGPNASTANGTYSVSIPADAISNTYLYATLSDNSHVYTKISIALIQTHTNSELQSQVNSLQSQNDSLQATNNTTTLLLYIALAVAALFIVTTVYILSLTMRGKKNRPTPMSTPSS